MNYIKQAWAHSRVSLVCVVMVGTFILGAHAPVRAESFVRQVTGKDGGAFDISRVASQTSHVVHAVNVAAGTPQVAIVAAAATDVLAPWFVDPQSRLVASGAFASVTVINASAITPTVSDLSAFDAVLVWSNLAFANADLLGDNLAQYVNNGGGVVIATFANSSPDAFDAPGGRWESHEYEIVIPHGGTTSGAATLGTVLQPAHPIMAGVGTFAGGSGSFRPTTTSLYSSSQLIATWSDGSTLVAVRDDAVGARVDLGFYPPSDAVMTEFWDSTTNGDLLLVNALLYAANRVPLAPGDTDGDGDSDETDYAVFVPCFTGSGVSPALAACVTFDFDRDDDVDCTDWIALSRIWSGVGPIPLPAACDSVVPTVSEWGLASLALLLLIGGTILLRGAPITLS